MSINYSRRLSKTLKHLTDAKLNVNHTRAMSISTSDSGVRIEKFNNNYLVTLSRPKALNALDSAMIKELTPFYRSLIASKTPCVVVMRGEGEKAFCAGGDVKGLYYMKKDGRSTEEILEFFKIEYELNQIIGTLPKYISQVSLISGITMGGGVGLSVHGNYRVATETSMFAMPETALGFFCDVGGSYFLPRLSIPGVGMWLALSGARLKGADTYHCGIATHYTESSKLDELQSRLLALTGPDQVSSVLDEFLVASPVTPWTQPSDLIEKHFSTTNHSGAESILKSCEETEWGQKQLKLMKRMSPTALKVVFRQLVEGSQLTFENCFRMEIDMARRFMEGTEFYEGVRSVLVDKDRNAKWDPPTLEEVSTREVDSYFANVAQYK